MPGLRRLKDLGDVQPIQPTEPEQDSGSVGPSKLTIREERFCERIASGMIQQDAVTGIGFRGTPGSLGVTACHLMKRPDIQAYINKLRSDHKKEYIMTREEALAYLTKAATEDPDDASMTSKSCEVQYVGMHGTPSPKQFSKKDALTLLGKFQGWEAPTKLTVEFEHIDFE